MMDAIAIATLGYITTEDRAATLAVLGYEFPFVAPPSGTADYDPVDVRYSDDSIGISYSDDSIGISYSDDSIIIKKHGV